MPRSWESALLNFETCRGDFASPFMIFEGLQDFFFTADKTRKHYFLIRPSSRHIRHFHSWEFIAMLSTLCFGPHQLLVDMGIAIFEGLQDFFTADKTRKPCFTEILYLFRPSSRHLGHIHSWNFIVRLLHIFFVPHQFGLFTWLRRGISMLWNENACKFCREAIGAVAYRQAGHPTPTPCLHNPSAIQGRQGTSIPLGRRRPGPPKATQLK